MRMRETLICEGRAPECKVPTTVDDVPLPHKTTQVDLLVSH
jgi:hypothetical protein